MALATALNKGKLKATTFYQVLQKVENWGEAVRLRLFDGPRGSRVLNLRNGIRVACRNLDWKPFTEVMILGGYHLGLAHLSKTSGQPVVLDLGANTGFFSLMAASAHPQARVFAFEPAPPNVEIIEKNKALNPVIGQRIQVYPQAVGGSSGDAQFVYDDANPEASGLFHNQGTRYRVKVRSFRELIDSLPGPPALVKMDIEGAEYDILEQSDPSVWRKIQALTIEVHPGEKREEIFLARMKEYGFRIEQEPVGAWSFFLSQMPIPGARQ